MPLIGLLGACTSPKPAESPAVLADSPVPAKPAKPGKSHRHALPEGVISVDIIDDNKRLHLLTGQHRQGQKSLWHQYSDDQGASWSEAVRILDENDLPANMVRGNKELALFGKLQARYPGVELITVATDAFLDDAIVNQVLDRSGLTLTQTWVFAEQFPEIIYTDVHKRWRGELPATHFLTGSTGKSGTWELSTRKN